MISSLIFIPEPRQISSAKILSTVAKFSEAKYVFPDVAE